MIGETIFMDHNSVDVSSKFAQVELNTKFVDGSLSKFSKGANNGNAPDPQDIQNMMNNIINKKEGE